MGLVGLFGVQISAGSRAAAAGSFILSVQMREQMMKTVWIGLTMLLLNACSSYGVIDNQPLSTLQATADSYSIKSHAAKEQRGEVTLILAFSGGGTRAAALSYGVLEALRDTRVVNDGHEQALLDEVDLISSVSGGSFTAAYYGLHGEGIFDDFEQVFLRRNVQGALIRGFLSPLQWLSDEGRTEMAVKYYEDEVFHGATFADMAARDGPLVLINASDLGYGVRFSFVQEYFNLLCSDLSSFPVARAVTASSAVPVLFDPVVLENYRDCKGSPPPWLDAAEQRSKTDPQLAQVIDGLHSYYDSERRHYAHFVDGGITDNLGLRAIYEIIEVAGGPQAFVRRIGRKPPQKLVIISVNAATEPEPRMDLSKRQPSLEETVNAASDVQLRRYDAATLELIDQSIKRWASAFSTTDHPVDAYFIQLAFKDLPDAARRRYFNAVPTSFRLSDEQVDRLIAAGHQMLKENADFQRFLAGLE